MMLLIGPIASGIQVAGAPPVTLEMPTSTHWKLSNVVWNGANPQFRGMTFTKDNVFQSNVTSVTSNIGDETTAVNRHFGTTSASTSAVMSTRTEFVWIFDAEITPDTFHYWAYETDRDCLQSADLEISHDSGSTWIKVGEYNYTTLNTLMDGATIRQFFGTPDLLAVSKQKVVVIEGGITNGLVASRQRLIVLEGRLTNGVAVLSHRLIVITKPTP